MFLRIAPPFVAAASWPTTHLMNFVAVLCHTLAVVLLELLLNVLLVMLDFLLIVASAGVVVRMKTGWQINVPPGS